MGKLHKIRKAFEQLPDDVKKEMSNYHYYSYIVSFGKKGRATICESVGLFGCRHGALNLFKKDRKEPIVLKGDQMHKAKRTYYFIHYLKALLTKEGYIKKSLKPYTRFERVKTTYQNYRPTDMIRHKAST